MGFPDHTEDVAQLRETDPSGSADDRMLLETLSCTGMFADDEKLEIVRQYRVRHGWPKAPVEVARRICAEVIEAGAKGTLDTNDSNEVRGWLVDHEYTSPGVIQQVFDELDQATAYRYEVKSVAEIMIDGEVGILGRLVVEMARRDLGETRERLASAMAQFAEYVTIGSSPKYHVDGVLLDIVADARVSR